MSDVVTGVIQEIEKRSVSGGKTAYNIRVAGESYGCGLYPPKAKEGDYVRFEVDNSRGYKNVARNSLKVNSKGPSPEAIAEAKATVNKPDAKQETIERQSATNSAIAYLAVLQAADALSLPKTDTKGKRIEAMDALLKGYVIQFYEGNTGKVWKDIAPAQGAEAQADTARQGEEDAAASEAAAQDDDW